MRSLSLMVTAGLLVGSGTGIDASAMEPIELASSPEQVEQPVAAEQSHFQAASAQLRQQATPDADLPLEFKTSTRPKAHPLLNLSF